MMRSTIYIKNKKKYLSFHKMIGCGPTDCAKKCGRFANSPYKTCCGLCNNLNGPHTPDCNDRYKDQLLQLINTSAYNPPPPSHQSNCVNRCNRDANPPYKTCCGACHNSNGPHTPDCDTRDQLSQSNYASAFNPPSYLPLQPYSRHLPPPSNPQSYSQPPHQSNCTNRCNRFVNPPHKTCCGACHGTNGPHTSDCNVRNQSVPFQAHSVLPATVTQFAQIHNGPPIRMPLNSYSSQLSSIERLYFATGSDHLPIMLINKDIAIISYNVLREYGAHHDKNLLGQNLPFLTKQYVTAQARAYQNIDTIQNILTSMPSTINLVVLCLQESTPLNYPITAFSQSFYANTEQPIIILKNTKYICTPRESINIGGSKNANVLEISNGTNNVANLINMHMVSPAAGVANYNFAKNTLVSIIHRYIHPVTLLYVIGDLNTADITSPHNGLLFDVVSQGHTVTDTNVEVYGNPIPICTHRAAGTGSDVIYDHIVEIIA